MKRSEKAEIIGQMLDELYPTTPVPLDHSSAYTLLDGFWVEGMDSPLTFMPF